MILSQSSIAFLAFLSWAVGVLPVAAQTADNGKRVKPVDKSPGKKFDLWGKSVPGLPATARQEIISSVDKRIGERVTRVTRPMITVHSPPPEKNCGAAVVICPGGGYNILAYDLEGTEVARWLNGVGVTAAVLHYRVPRAKDRPKHELPLVDVQRAIRLVRSRAKEFEVDSGRIGVLGFSAGGHLAAMASTAHESKTYEPIDEHDRVSCRPDFSVLVYPAYLNRKGTAELSPEVKVDDSVPPAILIHTSDDGVSSLGSVAYYSALKRSGVNAELHIFPRGGHGYGLRPSNYPVSRWPQIVEGWMKTSGILNR